MSAHDYEKLLARLTARREEPDAAADETTTRLRELDDRLLTQQADLLHAATTLHLRAPKLQADAEVGGVAGREAALRKAGQEADRSDAALARAMQFAQRPAFLPRQRRTVRHLAMYLLCAAGAALVESVAVASRGMAAASWLFLVAPLVALGVGYVLIGQFGRPRLLPQDRRARRALLPTRDPKAGLMVCAVVTLATAAWWLVN
ncbi:MAG TPA: hypothetical protein VE172_18790 [Stackebrandtia sp.]|uniref:hypothetical protein n=1 Tax=Stackebrandtia sp. TaxID=2023065 RepID=UPI002D6691A2|nr:hypothetical protein [Stackebrandtia sp.]HZE40851.1 hypothetical protein [Stackebrandtia sp.]